MRNKTLWIVLDKHGNLVNWHTANREEEGYEVHRTKRLAAGAAFKDEKVCRATITWEQGSAAERGY